MRIRITAPARGDLDGIDLRAFAVGVTYEVAASLGTYLITTACAEPVGAHNHARATSPAADSRFARAFRSESPDAE